MIDSAATFKISRDGNLTLGLESLKILFRETGDTLLISISKRDHKSLLTLVFLACAGFWLAWAAN